MNYADTAKLLFKIKLGDNRDAADENLIREWTDALGDIDFADADEAVRMHRRESTEYLQMGHIRANVRRIKNLRERDTRAARARGLVPMWWPDERRLTPSLQAQLTLARGDDRRAQLSIEGRVPE